MAERAWRACVLERAEEDESRRLELAALPEALAQAVPCVNERGLELDRVGELVLGLLGDAPLNRRRQRLAAQIEQPRLPVNACWPCLCL